MKTWADQSSQAILYLGDCIDRPSKFKWCLDPGQNVTLFCKSAGNRVAR